MALPTMTAEQRTEALAKAAAVRKARSELIGKVKEGKVTFHGFRRSDAVQKALRVLAENVPGVKGVEDDTQPMPIFIYGAA